MVFLWFSYGFPEGIPQVLLGILGEAKLVGHVHLLPTRKLGAGTPLAKLVNRGKTDGG